MGQHDLLSAKDKHSGNQPSLYIYLYLSQKFNFFQQLRTNFHVPDVKSDSHVEIVGTHFLRLSLSGVFSVSPLARFLNPGSQR